MCDLFLPSLEDMTALTGLKTPEEIIEWSHQQGAKTVVLKLGEKGALISQSGQSGQKSHAPAFQAKAIDATGAGDCFCGNLLARLAAGDDVTTATSYANAAASIAVEGFGAVNPLPKKDQVKVRQSTQP